MLYKILFLIAFLAHLPMSLEYVRRMWQTGHYQFFPLLLGVSLWLIYERIKSHDGSNSSGRQGAVLFALGMNSVLLSAAILLASSTVWIVSLVSLILVFIYHFQGGLGLARSFPAWVLLVFLIPLPGNLDVALITKMQLWSSLAASWILDAIGQLHFREGAVLVTEQKQFFAEEACSGVRSLFSSLAAIGVYNVLQGHAYWRSLFNLLQTIFWVVVGNAIRIALVIYVADNWTEAVTTGSTHEMLGLGVFFLIIGLSLSTDRALGAFVGQHAAKKRTTVKRKRDSATDVGQIVHDNSANSIGSGFSFTACGLIVLFVLIGAVSVRLTNISQLKIKPFRGSDYSLAKYHESDLPGQYGEWKLEQFEHDVRGKKNIFGNESYWWRYGNGSQAITVSVDGSYPEFHNLNLCYTNTGWKTVFEHDYELDNETAASTESRSLDCSTVLMMKPGWRGMVLFSAFDANQELVIPTDTLAYYGTGIIPRITGKLKLALGLHDPDKDSRTYQYKLPVWQIPVALSWRNRNF